MSDSTSSTSDRPNGSGLHTRALTGVTRRAVLKWTGIGVGGIVVAGAAGAGIRGGVNGAWSEGQGAPYELWTSWNKDRGPAGMIAAAALSANPHNIQPWRFVLSDTAIDVVSDTSRLMPKTDANDREHFVGLGAAIENMMLAGYAYGLSPAVQLFPEGEGSTTIARVTLGSGAATVSDLYRVIGKRHSNRGPYSAATVSDAEFARLVDQVEGAEASGGATDPIPYNGAPGLRLVHTAADKIVLGTLLVDAAAAIVADRQQSIEAFSYLRNDRVDIDRYRDGLTLDCQGLDPFTLVMAKILPADSRTAGDDFWLAQTKSVHTKTAAAYGIITVADADDRVQEINGGRLLQRLHLAATRDGLAFQHMNQITERIDRDRAQGLSDKFSARWSGVLGAPASTGLVTFRIGYPQRAGALSPRRAMADVITRS
jgi:hypothetical protein